MKSRRALKLTVLALLTVAAVVVAPRVVHAYRVHEAKVWCEELARQIREKYGPAGPSQRGYGEFLIDVSEFESTMPAPPTLMPGPGAHCRSYGDGFLIQFWWTPSPWTDSPGGPHGSNDSVGWSFDSRSEEWSKMGYFGPD